MSKKYAWSSNETKIVKKYVSCKKCMLNMQYLTEVCNLDAVCPFSKLLKALETSNSNRLVEFFEILSFSRNLPMEI